MFKLSFHNAGRWVRCPGSIQLAESVTKLPYDDTAASEGRAADELIAKMALGTLSAEETHAVDQDMLESAELYLDYLRSIAPLAKWVLEGSVTAPSIHPANKGRPDAYHFDRENDIVYVVDFKYGHRFVDVYGNYQLINGAAGVLDNTNSTPHTQVILTIIQPRCFTSAGPIRTWATTRKDLVSSFDSLRQAAKEAQSPGARCVTNDYCVYCPAAHGCEVLRQSALQACDIADLNQRTDLPNDVIGYELHVLESAQKLLKARIDATQADIAYRLRNGARIAGYHLEQSQGRENWTIKPDELIAMAELLGVNVSKPGVLTPLQSIKAGLPEELVKTYATRAPGEIKAVADKIKFSEVFK